MKNFIFRTLFTLFSTSLLFCSQALAQDFYINPVNGSPDNDGSYDRPWQSLKKVLRGRKIQSQNWETLPYRDDLALVNVNEFAPIKGGDTIWLMNGDYGDVIVESYYNTEPVTIKALIGHKPLFNSMRVISCANWILDGLYFNPDIATGSKPSAMLQIENHGWRGPSKDITIQNSIFTSSNDTNGWTKEDWDTLTVTGIRTNGARIVVVNNQLTNVRSGIGMSGPNALVQANQIVNFTGDGIVGLGNYSIYQNNLIKNSYAVNGNHDDGFQSWSVGEKGVGTGVVKGVILRGNTIINYEDENQPFRGYLQGIGAFNGMFEGWVVENNVIMVDSWHGISFYGAKDLKVLNNTVVDINSDTPASPRITVRGTDRIEKTEDNLIRNNIAHGLINADSLRTTADHNIIDKYLDFSMFVDYQAKDLRLADYSSAIDAGASIQAPVVDRDGMLRNQGDSVDIGAYESAGYSVERSSGVVGSYSGTTY